MKMQITREDSSRYDDRAVRDSNFQRLTIMLFVNALTDLQDRENPILQEAAYRFLTAHQDYRELFYMWYGHVAHRLPWEVLQRKVRDAKTGTWNTRLYLSNASSRAKRFRKGDWKKWIIRENALEQVSDKDDNEL